MAFTVKNWQDLPSTTTPLSAAALEDLEARVTAYADSIVGSGSAETAPILSPATVGRNQIQPSVASAHPLVLKGHVSQSVDLFRIIGSDDSNRVHVDSSGTIFRYTAPNIFGSFGMRMSADSFDRILLGPNASTIVFGPGTGAGDTNLYRAAASSLKTDDTFTALELKLGATGDANWRRNDPARLATDGRVHILPALAAGSGWPNHRDGLYVGATDPVTGFNGDGTGGERFVNIYAERQYHRSDPPPIYDADGVTPRPQAEWAFNTPYVGIQSTVNYGSFSSGFAAQGSGFAMAASQVISNSQNVNNEHAAYYGAIRYENGSTGSTWFTDWTAHSSTSGMRMFTGCNMHMNWHYSGGQPSNTPSVAYTASTWPGRGGSATTDVEPAGTPGTAKRNTYPMGYGFHVTGVSGVWTGGANNAGWNVGFKVGGGGVWCDNTRVVCGVEIEDHIDYGVHIMAPNGPSAGFKSILVDAGAGEAVFLDGLAIATKTGIPTDADRDNDIDGQLVVDNTNNHLYFRSQGVWRRLVPA